MQLRQYQSDGIDAIAQKYMQGTRRIIFQMPTGSGKTISFAGLVQRYLAKFDRKCVILVHRNELLTQTMKTLWNGFRIPSESLTADKKHISSMSKVYVGMVETAFNRMKKNPDYFGKVGLLIVDECHIGSFKKIYDNFPDALIIGFSATPISADKKDPLKNYFDDIVTGPSISELIEMGSLCQNETYSLKGVDRAKIKITRGEFDNKEMGKMYSNSKNVRNTVEAYLKLCGGQKTMVFNCNVEHSKLVNEAFLDAGLNSRHLDGTENERVRNNTLEWFKHTPDAILNNIGILTTGFDEPSVRNIIMNRATLSLPLWLQITGRGARPYPGKEFFRIIDMGGNVQEHGDWRMEHDWKEYFVNPAKAKETEGQAPIKACLGCNAIIPAQAVVCQFCGHIHERIISYDIIKPEFEKVVSLINVERIVSESIATGQKEWAPFFKILGSAISTLRYKAGGEEITHDIKIKAFEAFEVKVKEWRHLTGKPYSKHTKEYAWKAFCEQIDRINKTRLKPV